jgi:regulatory protein
MAGTITDLQLQKKRRDRVNVYLDGEFAFGLKDIVAARLQVGQLLSDADIAGLKEQDAYEETYHRALNFLSYRPRSTAEVRRRLHDKAIPDAVTEAVIERLTVAGLLDDSSFAEYWVEQRERFKPRSAQMIRHELRQKGVASYEIEMALDDLDETESARRLAAQRIHRYEHLEHDEFKRQLAGYLHRRGFRYETIESIIRELWQERRHGGSDS